MDVFSRRPTLQAKATTREESLAAVRLSPKIWSDCCTQFVHFITKDTQPQSAYYTFIHTSVLTEDSMKPKA